MKQTEIRKPQQRNESVKEVPNWNFRIEETRKEEIEGRTSELKDKSTKITQKLPQRNWQVKIKQMKLREMGDRTKRFNIVPRISYLRRKRMREGNIQGDNGLNFSRTEERL